MGSLECRSDTAWYLNMRHEEGEGSKKAFLMFGLEIVIW